MRTKTKTRKFGAKCRSKFFTVALCFSVGLTVIGFIVLSFAEFEEEKHYNGNWQKKVLFSCCLLMREKFLMFSFKQNVQTQHGSDKVLNSTVKFRFLSIENIRNLFFK